MRRGHLLKHPIAYKAVPKYEETAPRLPVFSDAQYDAYFNRVREEQPQLEIVFKLLIHTGADIGELFLAKVRDCDLVGLPARVRLKRTKRNTPERRVPMDSALANNLREYIAANGLRQHDLLLAPLERSEVERVHKICRDAIEYPALRIKDFRHIAAISWRLAGIDIMVIKDWLGHATLNQTMVYAAYRPDDADEARLAEQAAARLRVRARVLPMERRAG